MNNKLTMIFAAGLISTAASSTQPHQALIDLAYSEDDESELNGETFRIQLPIKQGVFLSGSKTEMDQDTDTASLFDTSYSRRELGGKHRRMPPCIWLIIKLILSLRQGSPII